MTSIPEVNQEAVEELDEDENLRLATADLLSRVQGARDSPLALYELAFTDEKGKPIVIKDFHQDWEKIVLDPKIERSIICASRELTKTSFMLAYAAWLVGKNPNIRIKWLSSDDETAKKRLAVIHNILDSQIYQWVFPDTKKLTMKESIKEKRPNTSSVLNVTRTFLSPESTIEASGILSTGVGGRCDALFCDDVVSESNALLSPSLRPKVINKFLSDWLATLVSDGKVYYIGTPWHIEDLMGYLKRRTNWLYKEYTHGKPGDPFWSRFPERWPSSRLKERYAEFGPVHYARAYLCQPLHEDTIAVKPSVLLLYAKAHLTQPKLLEAMAIVSLDPSSGKDLQKGDLDFTGVTIFLYCPRPLDGDPKAPAFEIFIPDAFHVRLPHVMQANLLWQLVHQWNAAHVVVESVGMQNLKSWVEEQRRLDPTLPLANIHPIASGNQNKGQRLMRITPLLGTQEATPPLVYFHPRAIQEAPQAHTVMVGTTMYEGLRDLRNQIVGFPTRHDDILDSFTYGLFWIHRNLVKGNVGQSRSPTFSCVSIG